jgi:hypothetical protein
MTGRPGRNLSVAGFGVASVWINIFGSVNRGRFKACADVRKNDEI